LIFQQVLGLVLLLGRTSATKDMEILLTSVTCFSASVWVWAAVGLRRGGPACRSGWRAGRFAGSRCSRRWPSAGAVAGGAQHRAAASGSAAAAAAPGTAGSRAGLRRDPASTGPGRAPQRVRSGSMKPLTRHHGDVLEPDRQVAASERRL